MVGTQAEWNVRKRDGRMVPFDGSLIARAISNAFRAELNLAETQPLEDATLEEIARMTEEILAEMAPLATASDGIEVEKVQDLVEMELMRRGHYRIARRYIVYRSEHAKVRALRAPESEIETEETSRIHVTLEDGSRVAFDENRVRRRLVMACQGLEEVCNADDLLEEVMRQVFDGISSTEIYRSMILASRSRIERDPAYDTVTSRLMLMVIYNDALGASPEFDKVEDAYRSHFEHYIICLLYTSPSPRD